MLQSFNAFNVTIFFEIKKKALGLKWSCTVREIDFYYNKEAYNQK